MGLSDWKVRRSDTLRRSWSLAVWLSPQLGQSIPLPALSLFSPCTKLSFWVRHTVGIVRRYNNLQRSMHQFVSRCTYFASR